MNENTFEQNINKKQSSRIGLLEHLKINKDTSTTKEECNVNPMMYFLLDKE